MQFELGPDYGISDMSTRKILQENLKALADAHPRLRTVKALEEATKKLSADDPAYKPVTDSTITRAKLGQTPINLDYLESIARVYGLEAWQLLVPRMSPSNPPVVRSVGDTEDKMYRKWRELAKAVVALEEPPPYESKSDS